MACRVYSRPSKTCLFHLSPRPCGRPAKALAGAERVRDVSAYNDTVLDHYNHPRNVCALPAANAVGQGENSACGDVLHLYLQIEEDHVAAASFKTFGCAAAIAAGSCLTEMVQGMSVTQLTDLRRQDIVDALGGLPPMKTHCSVLAEDAIRAALDDYGLNDHDSST